MINQIFQILRNQGPQYVAFRAAYEMKRKTGLLKRSYPTNPKAEKYITLKEWKSLEIPFIIGAKKNINFQKRPNEIMEASFKKIREGKIRYFNREWKEVNDWLTNPDSNYKYDISKHWTEIEDISNSAGDIKYVWEKSRFSYLYDVIRYDYHFEQDNSAFVFDEIDDWLVENPLNMGPNYKCSQETSLRCLNWIFALYFYQDSEYINEARWQKIMHSIHWQIRHVYTNINFSRICVRNNHAITECMMIYFGGLLFPFLKESEKWKKEGKKWLEEEIAYQVYKDGTFLQFSHNYQRVLLQLLTWSIAQSAASKETLSATTIERAEAVVHYMYHVCAGKEGQLPNYGSNDGALFFKLNDLDYTDFRPQINALYAVINHEHLYDNESVIEDALWMNQNHHEDFKTNTLLTDIGIKSFINGGIITIKEPDSFTFFKCAKYKDRPAHADNMHLDIWVDGINYLRDSGTYKYNTDENLINYFAGTKGHNSLMINGENQMIKGPRFIWYNWTKEAELNEINQENTFVLLGKARMFPTLGKSNGLWHYREVKKKKGAFEWTVIDTVSDKENKDEISQIWHPHPDHLDKLEIKAFDGNGNEIEIKKDTGYWSAYYGIKTEVPVWVFSTNTTIITTKINIRQ